MNTERRYVGGKTANACTLEQEAVHASLLQNATFLIAFSNAPLEQRLCALTVCFAAYTDRGRA
jgi:hypothetical protein